MYIYCSITVSKAEERAMKTNGGWKLILILLSTVIPADKWKQQQEEK
jgi:hypothetical protein